jgi:hypothetical protein
MLPDLRRGARTVDVSDRAAIAGVETAYRHYIMPMIWVVTKVGFSVTQPDMKERLAALGFELEQIPIDFTHSLHA